MVGPNHHGMPEGGGYVIILDHQQGFMCLFWNYLGVMYYVPFQLLWWHLVLPVFNFQFFQLCRNSLLDEDVATDNLYGSSSFSPPSQYSMMSGDNLTTEKILESGHTTYGLGGSKYTKIHVSSPTADWNREFVISRPSVKVRISSCFCLGTML